MSSINAADRVAVFGQTGSGKTTIVEALIASWRRVVWCDFKRERRAAGTLIDDGRLPGPADALPITWRPAFAGDTAAQFDALCWWALNRGNCTLVACDYGRAWHW